MFSLCCCMTSLPLLLPVNSWPRPQDTPVSHYLCHPPLVLHKSSKNHVPNVQEVLQPFIVSSGHQEVSYTLFLCFLFASCVHANIVGFMLTLAGFLICGLVYVLTLNKSLKYPLVLVFGHEGASALNNRETHFSDGS